MGRLIDADALKADYGMKDDCEECGWAKRRECEYNYCYSKMNFCDWIDDAETVEAIPVDWIEAQIPDSTEFYAVVTAIILRHLIDEYRKEQNNEQTE